ADRGRGARAREAAVAGRRLHPGALRAADLRLERGDRQLLQRSLERPAPPARAADPAAERRARGDPRAAAQRPPAVRGREVDDAVAGARERRYLRVAVGERWAFSPLAGRGAFRE